VSRQVVGLLAAGVLALAPVASATAASGRGDGGAGGGSGAVSGGGAIGAVTWDPGNGGFSDGGGSGCSYIRIVGPDGGFVAVNPSDLNGIDGRVYEGYYRTCDGQINGTVWIPRQTGADLAPAVFDMAVKILPLPEPQLNPPKSNRHNFAFVQVPLWWWVPENQWHPVSVTAGDHLPAGVPAVRVTVTAVPVELRFDPGDGSGSHGCRGPGMVPDTTDPHYLDFHQSACSYLYVHSSSIAGGDVADRVSGQRAFPASLSIVWQVTWVATDGTGGAFPDQLTTTAVPVAVAEVQALLEPGGSAAHG